jgi:hypothetical protein
MNEKALVHGGLSHPKTKANYPELVTFLHIFCVLHGILLYPSELEDAILKNFYAKLRNAVA